MSTRTTIAILGSLCLLGSIGLASAQTNPSAFLEKVDLDKDGTVTLDEVKSFASARFKALEKDRDGTLDDRELKGRLAAADFKSANADADTTIDEGEFMAYVEKLFKDANDGDASIDAKELDTPAGKKLVMLLQ